ncbi:subtilisin Carlsberg [Colletotrichum abscissum]|uniref:Subtilisin Carlsberg n=1 Tax=Colletotrichum abscissum TaxID=1671311 RepID=A0A9P9XP80_9PEZI|nr:subtilisin Carlsberg [Colletotrichum abscissum]KAI3557770.1 subtilisin Carlsberg [Colletotrichum abscissum]KAK1510163.1 subtilisin Carlsberg [Colletotrichum abscissum]
MRFSSNASLLLGLLASTSHAVVAADDTAAPAAPAVNEDAFVQGAYIVELNGEQDPSALYDELRSDGLAVKPRLDLKFGLFNGASFSVDDAGEPDITTAKIADKLSVKSVWPVRKIKMPKPVGTSIGRNGTASSAALLRSLKDRRDEAAKDTYSTHVMTQVDKLREAGFTGKGIKVAIVDTGVDYRHPALGGCFGEGCHVAYGWDFTGDNYYESSDAPTPDADPLDTCQGHGTHVAGIIMAQENELGFTGAAPDVTLGAYKVSGCAGYTTSEILVSAFYRAYEDGSDVISCSAGDDSGWASDAAGVAVSRIAEAGIPVVVAAGNSGNLGVWAVASPASGKAVAGIGSVDNTILPNLMKRGTFVNETGEFAFGWADSTPVTTANVTLRLWIASANVTACNPIPADIDLTDSIPLISMDAGCQSDVQAANLLARGAKYILFYPASESRLYPPYVYTEGILGIGMVMPRQAQEWKAHAENVTITIGPPKTSGLFAEPITNGPTAGYTSPFSSYGPTWELDVKPQFTAPGGGILSTWTWDQGEYMVNPGTSMSTPFVAAVYALVGQVRGTLDQETLRSVIAATAQPKAWNDGTVAHDDILAPVPQQGAGLVQAWDAAHATTILGSTGISFNDTDHFVGEHTFSVKNTAAEEVTYKLGHAKSVTVYTFTPGEAQLNVARAPPPTVDEWATINFETESLIVPAGGSADVKFTAVPPSGLNATLLPVYSGYITLEGSNGETLSVPYLGVGGSMRETPVLVPGLGLNGVYLSSTDNHFLIPVAANRTFTIPRPGSTGSAIYPKMVVTPTVGTTDLHVELVALGRSGNSTLKVTDVLGYPTLGALPQSPVAYAHRFGYTWNFGGFLADRTVVPEGSYAFIARALRIFGDASKEEDWDVVETVPFILKYLA